MTNQDSSSIIEAVSIAIFTIDFLLRLFTCPKLGSFFLGQNQKKKKNKEQNKVC
jgi:hypothetical protein